MKPMSLSGDLRSIIVIFVISLRYSIPKGEDIIANCCEKLFFCFLLTFFSSSPFLEISSYSKVRIITFYGIKHVAYADCIGAYSKRNHAMSVLKLQSAQTSLILTGR